MDKSYSCHVLIIGIIGTWLPIPFHPSGTRKRRRGGIGAAGHLSAALRSEMFEDEVDGLRGLRGADGGGDLVRGLGRGWRGGGGPWPRAEGSGGRLGSLLDGRLVSGGC